MKKAILLAALLLCCMLCGCSQASQVENHSYVLVMGLDAAEGEQLKMTVLVPKISSAPQQSSEGKGSSDSYIRFSITARDFESALSRLNWASPRDVTLSQIKLIVLSRELAESENCRELIESIAQTERLYTAAKVAVCEGSAGEFVEKLKPNIGARISEEIDSMYDHYINSGYVPDSSLAELYYQTESVYSDPMVTYAFLEEESKAAAVLSGKPEDVSAHYASEIPNRYLGAAVFSGGRMIGTLDGTQTIMANLLKNEVDAVRYECGGQSLNMIPARATYVRVHPDGDEPLIHINMHLSVAAQEKPPDEELLRASLQADLLNTIRTAQQMNAEPFAFAEKAARHFPTFAAWKEYNWIERFKSAKFRIDVHISRSDA